ncbi:hypothetical protein LAZ67_16002312 [Cordylochernes scorpioides]|uniref:Uncharacterized protein n=1 Tax=Cordylochernes scorpioides TaxID=51811 RepID=A0ABY6LBV6_9ARAC|nr:hypothetical protein LAZ67_16002312 [Cordylochernes scorpioides]
MVDGRPRLLINLSRAIRKSFVLRDITSSKCIQWYTAQYKRLDLLFLPVLRTCKKTFTYVFPRDAAERDLACTAITG